MSKKIGVVGYHPIGKASLTQAVNNVLDEDYVPTVVSTDTFPDPNRPTIIEHGLNTYKINPYTIQPEVPLTRRERRANQRKNK